jgi:hypothetical protein
VQCKVSWVTHWCAPTDAKHVHRYGLGWNSRKFCKKCLILYVKELLSFVDLLDRTYFAIAFVFPLVGIRHADHVAPSIRKSWH